MSITGKRLPWHERCWPNAGHLLHVDFSPANWASELLRRPVLLDQSADETYGPN